MPNTVAEAEVERVLSKMKRSSVHPEVLMGELTAVSESGIDATEQVTIYDTVTGLPLKIYSHQLKTALLKTRSDGKPAYWVEGMSPDTKPVDYAYGEFKCLLHPEHPDRENLNKVGLSGRYCRLDSPTGGKANLRSEADVRNHMRHTHPEEWDIINEHAERERRAAEDSRNQTMVEALTKALGGK